jgi:hypothetical protein
VIIHHKRGSPAVPSEAVMLMCAADANKNRDVAIVYITNAFSPTVVEEE